MRHGTTLTWIAGPRTGGNCAVLWGPFPPASPSLGIGPLASQERTRQGPMRPGGGCRESEPREFEGFHGLAWGA